MKISPVARHSLFLLAFLSTNVVFTVIIVMALTAAWLEADRLPAQMLAACFLALIVAVSSAVNRSPFLHLLTGAGDPWVNTAAGVRLVGDDNGHPDRPADRGVFAHGSGGWLVEWVFNPLAISVFSLSFIIGSTLSNAWHLTPRPIEINVVLLALMLAMIPLCLISARRMTDCPGEPLITVMYGLIALRARQATFLDPVSGRVRRVCRRPGEEAEPARAKAPRVVPAPRSAL